MMLLNNEIWARPQYQAKQRIAAYVIYDIRSLIWMKVGTPVYRKTGDQIRDMVKNIITKIDNNPIS